MPSTDGRPFAFARKCLMLLALGAFVVPAAPAVANSGPQGPEYSLSIVEGESTQPEYGIAHTSAHVHPNASLAVTIVRGGIPVARDTGNEGVWLSQVPQVGDVVTMESPIGTVVGSVVYDGQPSIDPTVCAGSVNFSGQRSAGQIVEGGYYSLVVNTDPYGHTSLHQVSSGQAQVTVLSGTAYAGAFLAPLAFGQTVWATESLQTPLAGGATFTYSSENDRPVGACPVPPPPPVPPAPPALLGSLARLLHTTIHKLLTSGWINHVTINQPGTVIQDLYQQGGTLPAFAASKHARHKHKKPAALLLARGSAKAAAAGTVSVVLHATSLGRRKLKHAGRVKAVLVTTLLSTSGAKLTLEQRPVTLHR
ncbi:MAG TPA: hypothetical protein VIC06_01990 [Solirubrobacteraceae bacterium]|jgi:hypothetical protein